MENKQEERPLMSKEEFEKYINAGGLKTFEAVSRFRSVKRAIRRGHVTQQGIEAPNRPFNNRANTSKRKGTHSRVNNELKKNIYARIKSYGNLVQE